MNILVEHHHTDLLRSFKLLFEERLGGKVYIPVGRDWYDKGWWKYSDNVGVVEQFLVRNDVHGEPVNTLILEQFIDTDIDIIIATVAQHELLWWQLLQKYKPRAKFIRQVGNISDMVSHDHIKNVMASAIDLPLPSYISNSVIYHQEFDTDIFTYTPPTEHKIIKNFRQNLPLTNDLPWWNHYESTTMAKGFEWIMHGSMGKHGTIPNVPEKMAEAIRGAAFIYHVKYGGDGFGHVWHNSYAMGRPIITKFSDYNNKMGGKLFEHGITGIDIEQGDLGKFLFKYSEPEEHYKMCENAYKRFKEVVDFDREEEEIRKFLDRLV